MLIALGTLFLLFAVDFVYIIVFFSTFLLIFVVCLVRIVIQSNKHYDELEKAEQEKARVKYVIIN
ncbi:hypothetical protein CVP04_01085 [Caviibacterium pharyngocola]|uniref:Uncharacterized protein n=2 Tax=Caviibacterium pharyngocola TaxID=28159 RepID=A0A2M8RZ18_9PAST|nr:hypothetical protein CVP04_01085 [Caviibacterium pharyngocola]